MPIYEYRCTECGHQVELLQKTTSSAPHECAHCHAKGTMQRQVSAPQFKLKGTGWYETDFKNKTNPKSKDEGTQSSNQKKTDKPADSA